MIGDDLKSGNILVTMLNGMMRLKVADFGTATLVRLTSHMPVHACRTGHIPTPWCTYAFKVHHTRKIGRCD